MRQGTNPPSGGIRPAQNMGNGGPGPGGVQRQRLGSGRKLGLGLMLLAWLWITVVFDPHWFIASRGITAFLRMPVFVFVLLLITLIVGVPSVPAWRKRWQWALPFLLFIVVAIVAMPFAEDPSRAWEETQRLLLWWTLIVASVAMIDTVRRAELLMVVYGLQFLWWARWGAKVGFIGWHSALANYDSFGALCVGGLGICYFLAIASSTRWFRWLMYATAAACVIGVVSSHARGAFLAMVAVFGIIWLRSPKKLQTLAFGIVGFIVVAQAANMLFEEGFFWNEISSAFEEGNSEGTGEDRWILWTIAMRVFADNPVVGAGLGNVGNAAAEIVNVGEYGSAYSSPSALRGRSLHSLYFTTLAETGIIGTILFGLILIDFWKRNRALATEAARRRWAQLGGRFDLRPIALGLEASMVAFLLNGVFYGVTDTHWLYTMLAVNMTLHSVVARGEDQPSRKLPARRRGGRPVRRQAAAPPPLPLSAMQPIPIAPIQGQP